VPARCARRSPTAGFRRRVAGRGDRVQLKYDVAGATRAGRTPRSDRLARERSRTPADARGSLAEARASLFSRAPAAADRAALTGRLALPRVLNVAMRGSRRATRRRAQVLSDGLAIRDRLAIDPGNAEANAISGHEKMGDVQVAQGRPRRRAQVFPTVSRSPNRLAQSDPGNVRTGAGPRCPTKDGQRAGRRRPRRRACPAVSPSPTAWRNPIPATPVGSAIPRCPTRKEGAGRAGRPAGALVLS
jgi:hypothetical protein